MMAHYSHTLQVFLVNNKLGSKDFYRYLNGVWIPNQDKFDSIQYLRVLGWQKINGKLHWIFSYTQDENKWGLYNYGLIPQGYLKFIKLDVQKK